MQPVAAIRRVNRSSSLPRPRCPAAPSGRGRLSRGAVKRLAKPTRTASESFGGKLVQQTFFHHRMARWDISWVQGDSRDIRGENLQTGVTGLRGAPNPTQDRAGFSRSDAARQCAGLYRPAVGLRSTPPARPPGMAGPQHPLYQQCTAPRRRVDAGPHWRHKTDPHGANWAGKALRKPWHFPDTDANLE